MNRMNKQHIMAALLAAAYPLFSAAQSADVDSDSAIVLGQVVVHARRSGPLPARSVFSSVDVLGGDIAAEQNVRYSWELLGRMPGVQLTDMGQGAVSGGFSFRGFNGERELNAVKLLIDGVPANNNAGNMPYFDMISPLDIASITVVRGTNDPRYGLHNIAGNVSVATRSGGDYNEARLSGGSFGSRDLQFARGSEADGLAQNYSASVQHADGYRAHADSDKVALAGKWMLDDTGGRMHGGVIARYYENQTEEPGYLTAAEARTAPRASPARNASDGGKRKLGQLSGHFDMLLGERLSWSSLVYLNRVDDRRWVTFSPASKQQERYEDETHAGAAGTLTYRPVLAWLHDLALEGGANVEHQSNRSLRWSTVSRVRASQTRDQDFEFDTSGAFVQAVIRPSAGLKLIPAYRVDTIAGDLRDSNGRRYGINRYGSIGQPKLSAVYALNDTCTLYGNWGRSFQVGAGAGSYDTANSPVQASINDGWESGLKFAPDERLEGRIAVWRQVASNEARRKLGAAANDVENIGRTERRGIDFQLNLKLARDTAAWFAYSVQKSRIVTPDQGSPQSKDKEVDHVPRYLVTGGIDYRPAPKWKLSYWANGQGDYYLERSNASGKFGRHFLSNIGANYQWSPDTRIEFQVKNLSNRYWEYVWHDGAQSLHAPGSPRALFLAAHTRF